MSLTIKASRRLYSSYPTVLSLQLINARPNELRYFADTRLIRCPLFALLPDKFTIALWLLSINQLSVICFHDYWDFLMRLLVHFSLASGQSLILRGFWQQTTCSLTPAFSLNFQAILHFVSDAYEPTFCHCKHPLPPPYLDNGVAIGAIIDWLSWEITPCKLIFWHAGSNSFL